MDSKPNLLTELSRRPLICDGAMGTQLMARGMPPGNCSERWGLDRPEVLGEIHRAYLAAGCDLITTNSFGSNRVSLERHGLQADALPLSEQAARVARQAVDQAGHGWVLGDMGPLGVFLEPVGEMLPEQAAEVFREQAAALVAGGVDGFIIETMADPAEVVLAVRAAKSAAPLPVFATYTFEPAGGQMRTMMGTTPTDAVKTALDAGADAVGANCGTSLSLEDYCRLAEEMVAAAGASGGSGKIILQPNAGTPHKVGAQMVHDVTPAQMAAAARRLRAAGAGVIGGCCGTTPEHMRAVAAVLVS